MVRGISIGGAAPLGGVGLRQPTQNDAAPFPYSLAVEARERVCSECGRAFKGGADASFLSLRNLV
jgi:hypothetical protein